MPGTSAGAAKRKRCATCGSFAHPGKPCWAGKRGPAPIPLLDLIEAHRVVHEDGCHSWKGRRWGGRPSVGAKGRRQRIARVLLDIVGQPGIVTRHTCDNDWCINPEHLLAGTQKDNMQDMIERGRARWQRGTSDGETTHS